MQEAVLSNVLLESGTNELEILEFTVDNRKFGINVAKINIILKYQEITPMPKSKDYIEGVIQMRDKIVTVIDLAKYLGLNVRESSAKDTIIVTYFNNVYSAFHVHDIDGIHRISWKNIGKPDKNIYGGDDGLATGITNINDNLVTILDFERIVFDINPETNMQYTAAETMEKSIDSEIPIFIAEDSPMLLNVILKTLSSAGFKNLKTFENGEELWHYLNQQNDNNLVLSDYCKIVITDIEMPQMDGHHLLSNIRKSEAFEELPVIIFSSITNPDMRLKGESLGATEQITKPEIDKLISIIKNYS